MTRSASLAVAIGCGVAAACLYQALLLGSPGALILVYLAQLPLFLAGLWLGTGMAAVAGLTGCVIMLAASDAMAAGLFAALNAGPAVLLIRQALLARRDTGGAVVWYPPGLLTAWLTVFGLAGMATVFLLTGGPGGLQSSLTEVVGRALDRLAGHPIPDRETVVATIAAIVPGTVTASWMLMAVINGCLAQGVLIRFGANWRPSPDLSSLNLPYWVAILLGVAAAATLVAGAPRFIGINIMIALFLPFCLAGLAVLHAAARRLTHPAPALIAFYAMSGFFGWPLLAVAVLGLLENWLGLRRRLAPSGGMIDG
jgi:hypothetical protein